ncbi:MAG: hypothetical protein NC313_17365 [Butyrivibrio sp.]|nr:hypothetical protein [Butyrivibrio sp.]
MRFKNNAMKLKDKLVNRRYDIMQGAGLVCMQFGVCGIAGAIECDTNLVPAVLFFAVGCILMVLSKNIHERNDG